jgi:hypothetical protein
MGFFDKLTKKQKFNPKKSINRYSWGSYEPILAKCVENYTYVLALNYITKAFVESAIIVNKYDHTLKTWVRDDSKIAQDLEAKFRYLSTDYSNLSIWYSILHNYFDKGIGIGKINFDDATKTGFDGLTPISHDKITFTCSNTTGVLKSIQIGENSPYPVDEFLIFRHGLSDKNLEKGIPMAEAGKYALTLDNNLLYMVHVLAQNLGVEIPLISPKPGAELEETNQGELDVIWKNKTTGENRGDPIVANFPIDVQMVGAKLADLNTKDLFWSSASKVAAMFPLDLGLLGFQTGSSVYNDKVSAKENFYDTMMLPLQSSIAQEISRQILPRYYGKEWKQYAIAFDYSKVPAVQRIVARNRESVGTLYREKVIDRMTAKSLANIPFTQEDIGIYYTLNQVNILDNSGDPDKQGLKVANANNQLP